MTTSPVLIDSACRIAAPLPAVHGLQMQAIDAAFARCSSCEQLARAVGRAVVDDDDLLLERRRVHLVENQLDRVALVVDRNEHRQPQRGAIEWCTMSPPGARERAFSIANGHGRGASARSIIVTWE